MSDSTHLPWEEGLPTRPDVDLLLKTWPAPKVGDRLEYEAVEALLGVTRKDNRFRTITTQWRKRLQEKGIVLECEPGTAFYVASAEQISSATYGTLKFIGRKARRHRLKLSTTAPKDDQQRQVIEHQGRLMLGIEKDARKSRMNLLPSTAVPEQPKIAPPKKAAE